MTSENVRIAVLPRDVASDVVTGAVSRAGWAVAVAIILLTAVVLTDMVWRRSGPEHVLPPLAALAGMLGLLALVGRAPSTLSRIAFIAGGAVLSTVYQVALLRIDQGLNDSAEYLLNRPAFVLVIGAAGIVRPLAGLLWGLAGFVAGTASLLAGAAVVGLPPNPGWGSTIALAFLTSAYLTLAGIRVSQANHLADLHRLEEETRSLALDHQFEQRAAALIHDTVLSDLTAVMNTDGPLHERARERFRADVATLADASWLRESREALALDPQDSALRNGMVALTSELQWRGLTVDITGNPENQVVRLSPEQIDAVHAAVRACLENVLQHSGVATAELVLGAGDGFATVMVIDHGVGFDTSAVAGDRLGLRSSVIRRIEEFGGSVRVWSRVGGGTSVMMSMPCEVLSVPGGSAEQPAPTDGAADVD